MPNEIPSLRIDILSCLHVSVFGSHYLAVTQQLELDTFLLTNDERFACTIADVINLALACHRMMCFVTLLTGAAAFVCRPGGVCSSRVSLLSVNVWVVGV